MLNDQSRAIRDFCLTVLLLLLYGSFACRFINDFMATGRLSSLLFVLFESFIFFIVIARHKPKQLSPHFTDWVFAALGTLMPTLFTTAPTQASPLWFVLQMSGVIISLIGVCSLNLSFGIVPANRGVKTRGIYHYIRHPLYAGYMLSNIAIVAQNLILINAVIFSASLVVQVIRIRNEEKLLCEDETYRDYTKQVQWRLVPKLW